MADASKMILSSYPIELSFVQVEHAVFPSSTIKPRASKYQPYLQSLAPHPMKRLRLFCLDREGGHLGGIACMWRSTRHCLPMAAGFWPETCIADPLSDRAMLLGMNHIVAMNLTCICMFHRSAIADLRLCCLHSSLRKHVAFVALRFLFIFSNYLDQD